MPDDEQFDEPGGDAEARAHSKPQRSHGAHGSEPPRAQRLQGSHLGVDWNASVAPRHATLTIGGKEVHLRRDTTGFVTHEMVGRWPDLEELARAIIRFHPDYSPLAKRPLA